MTALIFCKIPSFSCPFLPFNFLIPSSILCAVCAAFQLSFTVLPSALTKPTSLCVCVPPSLLPCLAPISVSRYQHLPGGSPAIYHSSSCLPWTSRSPSAWSPLQFIHSTERCLVESSRGRILVRYATKRKHSAAQGPLSIANSEQISPARASNSSHPHAHRREAARMHFSWMHKTLQQVRRTNTTSPHSQQPQLSERSCPGHDICGTSKSSS
jgi:hypothetical protein